MKKLLLSIFLSALLLHTFAQEEQFSIDIELMNFPNSPAVHSGAFAQWEGKWIFIGGRTNGLHGFLPPLAFPSSGVNDSIFVVDPENQQVWSASVENLDTNIREPITSSNIPFHQEDSILYMAGGYGWKEASQDFRTFATLTAIDVSGLTSAVMNSQPITPYFRQMEDSSLAITGGHLHKLGDAYFLAFGHRFDGIYDVETHSGFFEQEYSNAIRKFEIYDDGDSLVISNYEEWVDTANFHRRDINVVPQVFSDGETGMTGFSGVFQYGIDIPFFTTVNITEDTAIHIPDFNQNLSQYENATLPIYDAAANHMHTVFFGGMSMYRLDSATQSLEGDSMVPFVSTISQVTRDDQGNLSEFKLPVEMPGLEGSNAYFIPHTEAPYYHNRIIDLNQLPEERILVGYIFGGILSPQPNISDSDASVSIANPAVYKVFVDKTVNSLPGNQVLEPVEFSIFPNPSEQVFNIELNTTKNREIEVAIHSLRGKMLETILIDDNFNGTKKIQWNADGYSPGIYYCRVKSGNYSKAYKLVLME